jgi:chromosome segregation protein
MTAVAILFSLLKTRPSPFVFLDEVDAALDEANVKRFTALLEDFSRETQMVIITHNKRTMEIADTLYGVTMEEPGISKVVSMKLTKN